MNRSNDIYDIIIIFNWTQTQAKNINNYMTNIQNDGNENRK